MEKIYIDEKYIKENRKRMKKLASEEPLFEYEDNILMEEDTNPDIEILEFEDGSLKVSANSDVVSITVDIPIDDDTAFKIIEWMKSKGEKLNELLRLSKHEKEADENE